MPLRRAAVRFAKRLAGVCLSVPRAWRGADAFLRHLAIFATMAGTYALRGGLLPLDK